MSGLAARSDLVVAMKKGQITLSQCLLTGRNEQVQAWADLIEYWEIVMLRICRPALK